MSNHHHNDYQNANGTKGVSKLAAIGGKKAEQAIRKVGLKAAKRLGSIALKKIGTGLLVKTAPIWGAVVIILFLVLGMVSVFLPDVSAEKASDYESLANELGIPAKHLLAFDTVLYENEDLEDRNPNDSAYYFIRIIYERFKPEKTVCEKEGENGECLKSVTQPEEVIEHREFQGKSGIQSFFRSQGQPTDNIPAALNGIRGKTNTRIMVMNLSVEIAMEQARFSEEQIEHFNEILEAGFLDEEFPSLGFSMGYGATCSPNKEINTTAWNNAFANAGAFKGYGDKFIEIANKQGIDPVLMAAIAFHETGIGTSNALKNKNNPGGLMNPNGSGLFVFATLNDGLESLGRTLHNRIIKDGKNTVDKLGSVYAPLGAANDPNNLNRHWVPRVTEIIQNLGGLTMNCESAGLFPGGIEGASSKSAETIASAGFKWVGNSRYVFGGGRNQSDIGRGYFDCSSFVHWAYLQAGIQLGPLGSVSTETLNKTGKRISINEIQVGDIIFWDTYKRDGHVGIYIGNGKWIGAQSSTGVAVEDLNNSYWRSVFSGHVRRILN
ncbi:NlpC/P60 family protein [Cytobacillus pseudoceanisediminis]|uniref:C40 family peptidase n=1 Tax=Cytobacillus pseudoceanisediminis TaxID=3051614 RepID=UPI003C2B37CB